jgi:hypothetical protein
MSHDDGEKKGLQYSSTDDKRTEVGNGTRQQYRTLSALEQAAMADLKDAGEAFIRHCRALQADKPEAGREFALAITHMEDAVMRAVRGVTQ